MIINLFYNTLISEYEFINKCFPTIENKHILIIDIFGQTIKELKVWDIYYRFG